MVPESSLISYLNVYACLVLLLSISLTAGSMHASVCHNGSMNQILLQSPG
jgi:hypothetical protein